MIQDLTPAKPMNWASLRYEFAMAQSALADEVEAKAVRQETIDRLRAVMARADTELVIMMAKLP